MSNSDINEYKNIHENKNKLMEGVNPTFETSSMFSILQTMLNVSPVQEWTCSYKVQINGRYGHERTECITRTTDLI
jgi:hypothetical protein